MTNGDPVVSAVAVAVPVARRTTASRCGNDIVFMPVVSVQAIDGYRDLHVGIRLAVSGMANRDLVVSAAIAVTIPVPPSIAVASGIAVPVAIVASAVLVGQIP